jgi:predicted phosphodiesterase
MDVMSGEIQHELIKAVKELALELGRTPTRGEFEAQVRGGAYRTRQLFKNYSALLLAAGLDTYDDRRSVNKPKKIDGSVFNKSLEAHLEQYKPKEYVEQGDYPSYAIISDIHWPFESQRVINKFYLYVAETQPEFVIINGDAWDMYSHSKYPRSHNIFTPREEMRLAREGNEKFWAEIRRIAPNAKCIQMMGNHDVRPLRRILEVYPMAEDWMEEKLKDLFTFEGVHTIMDPREEFFIREDIAVFHGYMSKLGGHRDFTLISCNTGHTHKGGTVFRTVADGRQIFEANSGVAGDPYSKGLAYTSQKLHNMTPGFIGSDKWGPRFVPC